jgi:hypothetical protein
MRYQKRIHNNIDSTTIGVDCREILITQGKASVLLHEAKSFDFYRTIKRNNRAATLPSH